MFVILLIKIRLLHSWSFLKFFKLRRGVVLYIGLNEATIVQQEVIHSKQGLSKATVTLVVTHIQTYDPCSNTPYIT